MKFKFKNNFFLILIYSIITFFASIIITQNINSFNTTVILENFYSDDALDFSISGNFSETLDNDSLSKIFSKDKSFMLFKKDIRNNLSGMYISGDYSNYLNILQGNKLTDNQYKDAHIATTGDKFKQYHIDNDTKYITIDGIKYNIIGVHNSKNLAWYNARGIIRLQDDYISSKNFTIAGDYILDGHDSLEKFNQIKELVENNSNLSVILHENTKGKEIISYLEDTLPIFMFMILISFIFILNAINITTNWFSDKLRTIGIMRAFGATKKNIVFYSLTAYLKQIVVGFFIGYSLFIMNLIVNKLLMSYSVFVLVLAPFITFLFISLIGLLSLWIPLFKILKITPMEVMKSYG